MHDPEKRQDVGRLRFFCAAKGGQSMSAATTALQQLGFRVIKGGRSGPVAVLKSPGIAEIFGVQHGHVLRDIRDFRSGAPNLERQFANHCRDSTYRDSRGKDQSCFELTKVGFIAVAAKYDPTLRFLAAVAFDALEHDDVGTDIVNQINARVSELRLRATAGQNELFAPPALKVVKPNVAPPPITETPISLEFRHGNCEDDPKKSLSYRNWDFENEIIESEAHARDVWLGQQQQAPLVDGALALDRWIDDGWHVRRRCDQYGNPFMLWITRDDAITTSLKFTVVNPTGKQVMLCLNDPFAPIEVIERNYDKLGDGPFAAIGKATIKHILS